MSFLCHTGLNGSLTFLQPQTISPTLVLQASKRGRIQGYFCYSPLQNSSSSIGSGTILKVLNSNSRKGIFHRL